MNLGSQCEHWNLGIVACHTCAADDPGCGTVAEVLPLFSGGNTRVNAWLPIFGDRCSPGAIKGALNTLIDSVLEATMGCHCDQDLIPYLVVSRATYAVVKDAVDLCYPLRLCVAEEDCHAAFITTEN